MLSGSKDLVRKNMLAKRNSLSRGEIDLKSSVISEKLLSLPEVHDASKIAAYMSLEGEVSTRELISKLVMAGKDVFVPFMGGGKIKFTKFVSFTDIVKGDYKVPEPAKKDAVDYTQIDIFIVPGVAFDSQGYRLGWGKGFYDRFFSENNLLRKKRIGVCFDFQLLEKIPHEEHDIQMNVIVTNSQVIKI